MASKLDYAKPSTPSPGRSVRTMLADALAGFALIFAGLFGIVLLVFVTEPVSGSTYFDEVFEKPSRAVRRGFVRITRGREAAENCER
jgi:hypothetical protein